MQLPTEYQQFIHLSRYARWRHDDERREQWEETVARYFNFFQEELKSWPIYISTKPIKSIYKNILYIGDAFYTFLPTIAQGASQAIEGANEVFNLIENNHQNIQNIYFKNREERINTINKRSKFNYFSFHISNQLLKILRNKLLKILVKNKNFISSYLGKIYK